MFSVLLPVQNYDISSLVNQLLTDARESKIAIEIIISDDGSSKDYAQENARLAVDSEVHHVYFEEERGRSANRNGLAERAEYAHLIFIDADSGITPGFLKRYADSLSKADVLVGGTAYDPQFEEKAASLRYQYGIQREQVSAAHRNEYPFRSFTANNFCVSKQVFQSNKFDETIKHYGHEDTLFGKELQRNHVSIAHIDNAVFHLGLESNSRFLEKTFTGIQTLVKLFQEDKLHNEDVRLLGFYFKWKGLGLGVILNVLGAFILGVCKRNLLSNKPSLRLFDLYKLVALHQELKRIINRK